MWKEAEDVSTLPTRKHIRIDRYDYATPGAYFITICTANREKLFWNGVGADSIRPQDVPLSPIGKIVEQGILQIAKHYEHATVDTYCIMPDHIHLIVSIRSDENGRMISAPTIPTIIGSMKRWVSKQIGRSIWQKSFYEHGLRHRQDYDETWQYIENNPLKYRLQKA